MIESFDQIFEAFKSLVPIEQFVELINMTYYSIYKKLAPDYHDIEDKILVKITLIQNLRINSPIIYLEEDILPLLNDNLTVENDCSIYDPYRCKKCNLLALQAYKATCGCLVCRKCIQKQYYLKNKQCPSCSQSVAKYNQQKEIENFVTNMMFECPFCDFKQRFKEVQGHILICQNKLNTYKQTKSDLIFNQIQDKYIFQKKLSSKIDYQLNEGNKYSQFYEQIEKVLKLINESRKPQIDHFPLDKSLQQTFTQIFETITLKEIFVDLDTVNEILRFVEADNVQKYKISKQQMLTVLRALQRQNAVKGGMFDKFFKENKDNQQVKVFEDQINKLEKQLQQYNSIFQQYTQNVTPENIQTTINELQQKIQTLDADNVTLKVQYNELSEKFNMSHEELLEQLKQEQAQTEYSNTSEFSQQNRGTDEYSLMMKDWKRLQSEANKHKMQNSQLKLKIMTLQEDIDDKALHISNLEQQISEVQQDTTKKASFSEDQVKLFSSSSQTIIGLENKIKQLQDELQNVKDELNNSNKIKQEKQEECENIQKKYEQLKSKNILNEQKTEEQIKQLSQNKHEIENLSSNNKERDQVNLMSNKYKNIIQSIIRAIPILQSTVNFEKLLDQKFMLLEQKLQATTQQSLQLAQKVMVNKQLYTNMKQQHTSQIDIIKSMNTNVQKLQRELQQQKQVNQEQISNQMSHISQLTELKSENQKMRNESAQYEKQRNYAVVQQQEARDQLITLQRQVKTETEDLKNQFNSIITEFEICQKSLQFEETDNTKLRDKLQAMENEVVQLRKVAGSVQQQKDFYENKMNNFKIELIQIYKQLIQREDGGNQSQPQQSIGNVMNSIFSREKPRQQMNTKQQKLIQLYTQQLDINGELDGIRQIWNHQ